MRKVDILPGNVGYLEMTSFFRPEEAADAIATAMHALAHTDALIVDMRANGGGSPGTIAILISYAVDGADTLLFDITHRRAEPDLVDHYRTTHVADADRNTTRPMYVLTSASTFSGGEGLAYLLQERHRAEVVGEVTGGGANPGRPYPVGDRFDVVVPNGRLTSALRRGNWEGSGVTPDVKTTAAEAFPTAYARALRVLIEREPPGPWRDTLERALRAIPPSR